MAGSRQELWIAMSALWLDTELVDERIKEIAVEVRASGLSSRELEEVFELELAPILGWNCLVVAGEWAGFDPDWVCERAAAQRGKRRIRDRILAAIGGTTFAARPTWLKVKQAAFPGDSDCRKIL
ncbi:MAG: hypothetical protein AAGG02_10335 [Cyanobacteria bacterium P01_H01_bin.15]